MDKAFYVYILKCSDGTLYCGYAADLAARVKAHNDGKGAKYTKGRLPVSVVFAESYATKSEAMKRENKIKKMNRSYKLKLTGHQSGTEKQQAEDKK